MDKLKKLFKYFNGNIEIFTLAIVATIIATAFSLIVPLLIKYTIDSVIGSEPVNDLQMIGNIFGENLVYICLAVVGLTVGRSIFLFFKGYLTGLGSEKIAETLRNELFTHIQHLPYNYHSRRETGDLIQRCTSDIETVRRFIGLQFVEIARIVFMVIIITGLMLMLDPMMTLIAMILIPGLFYFSYWFFTKIQEAFKKSDEAEAKLTTVLQENLAGVRVVRAFGREKYEIEKFQEVNEHYYKETFRLIELFAYFWSFSDLMALIQSSIVLLVGTIFVVRGEMILGTLVAFTMYERMLLWPVRQLGRILTDFGKATVAIDRIEEILNEPLEEDDPSVIEPEIDGSITFDHVSFEYDDGTPILKDINFNIKRGETIGILGPTGSGKSTLVNLLTKMYGYKGSIKIDGYELSDIKTSHIRKNVGLVLQESFLYAKTIFENIGISNPKNEKDRVEHVSKVASIHDSIVAFDEGYETMVGEKGVSLSGGQKQRMAIARTILNDKKILIFDDSLSAVDNETDQRIRRALREKNADTTTIIISHRISTLSEADRVLVLEDGVISQDGNHLKLIKEDGLYRKIYDIQTSMG